MFQYLYEDVRQSLIDNSLPAAKRMRFTSIVPKANTNTGGKSKVLKGDAYINRLRDVLSSELGYTRSDVQTMFHEAFICAVGRFLYSKDGDEVDMTEIMKQQGWDTLKQQVLCMTPRRFGKTVSVSMFLAAMAWVVPGCELAVFSTGRRASSKLLELTAEMMLTNLASQGVAERVVKNNQESLWISHGGDRTSKISSYPACAKTLRGVGADVIIMEEAAFISADIFYEVIVPLLEVDSTALICISTPQDSLNFYSNMFTIRGPDGELMFKSIRIGLACEACEKAGKAASCTHGGKKHVPPWKSAEKFDMVKSLYSMAGKSSLLERESMGVISEDTSSVFAQARVEKALEAPGADIVSVRTIQWLLCTVDPTGGGASNMSCCTSYFARGHMVIEALHGGLARGHDAVETMIMNHIAAVRVRFPSQAIFVAVENNMGQEASHIYACLQRSSWRANLHYVHENNVAGVRTTQAKKELMVLELQKYVSQEALVLSKRCHAQLAQDKESQAMLEECRSQLLAFRRVVLVSNTLRSDPRVLYSGKTSGGGQDDYVIALGLGAYWGTNASLGGLPGLPTVSEILKNKET